MSRLLREIAYVRSGDKGNICSFGVIAMAPEHYETLLRTVTPRAHQATLRRFRERRRSRLSTRQHPLRQRRHGAGAWWRRSEHAAPRPDSQVPG